MDIASLIYSVNRQGFYLWVVSGSLKFRLFKTCDDQAAALSEIKVHKPEVIRFLEFNGIVDDSYQAAVIQQRYIYRVPEKSQVLSFAQERLWFIERYEAGTNAYNIHLVFELTPALDLDVLQSSLVALVHRHETLRTVIKEHDNGHSYQEVLDDSLNPLVFRHRNVNSQCELAALIKQEVNAVFDLSQNYPIRVCSYDCETDTKRFISIVFHHITFDGWSMNIIMRELSYLYFSRINPSLNTAGDGLPEITVQYRDFSLWQKQNLNGEKVEEKLSYWREKLEGYENLQLVCDKPRPKKFDYKGATVFFELDEAESAHLRDLAKLLGISLYSLMLSAYVLFLKTWSQTDDVVIGTPSALRDNKSLEPIVGFFINMIMLRCGARSSDRLTDYILQVAENVNQAQQYGDVPFDKLVSELSTEQDSSRSTINQAKFDLQGFGHQVYNEQNLPDDQNLVGSLMHSHVPEEDFLTVSLYDIALLINDSKACLLGKFIYAKSLFDEDTAKRWASSFLQLLRQFTLLNNDAVYRHDARVASISYLDDIEKQQVLLNGNALASIATKTNATNTKTVIELFEKQVACHPDQIAIVFDEQSISYGELDALANRLANYLIENYQPTADTFIPICLQCNEQMIIAVLAILKSGAAYVPLDVNVQVERLAYCLDEIEATLLLTNQDNLDQLQAICEGDERDGAACAVDVLAIDGESFQQLLQGQSQVLDIKASSQDLAYIIYTSGTTGKPKAVMIEHQNLVQYVEAIQQTAGFSNEDRHLLLTNIIFDLGYTSLWGALLTGGRLCLVTDEAISDVDTIVDYIYQQKISVLKSTPLYFKSFLDVWQQQSHIKESTLTVLLGGEKLGQTLLDDLAANPTIVDKLFNHYGPTECTVGAICTEVNYKENASACSSFRGSMIGRPLAHMSAYVLNDCFQPLPVGAVGELFLSGLGVARGYYKQPELTAEKFIANPFVDGRVGHDRLYRTGDLVRWLPDGQLDYLGRNDSQIKIRGYRVEPAELEAVLLNYPAVKQCAVSVSGSVSCSSTGHDSRTQALLAYYVSESALDEPAVFAYLSARLPRYMLPSALIYLESLPLTHNGKLDRKNLPPPGHVFTTGFTSPTTALERKICQLWSKVLGVPAEQVGVDDDFFALGGNNILTLNLISLLNKVLSEKVQVADILNYPSISKFVSHLETDTSRYQVLQPLNNANNSDLPPIFMVHPSVAGSEVYQSLAFSLVSKFHCYGVDHYNLYHEAMIDNLDALALKYVNAMDGVSVDTIVRLLGWSLGGRIALQMAAVLEKKGIKNIHVYLLDTHLSFSTVGHSSDDDYMVCNCMVDNNGVEDSRAGTFDNIVASLRTRGYTDHAAQQMANVIQMDNQLSRERLCYQFTHTKITLMKAMKDSKGNDGIKTTVPLSETTYQNEVDEYKKIVTAQDQLRVVNIDIDHMNILSCEQDIDKVLSEPMVEGRA